ncbi:hypothetical protein Rsub_12654, partial [Raphidocelis subcapitata]
MHAGKALSGRSGASVPGRSPAPRAPAAPAAAVPRAADARPLPAAALPGPAAVPAPASARRARPAAAAAAGRLEPAGAAAALEGSGRAAAPAPSGAPKSVPRVASFPVALSEASSDNDGRAPPEAAAGAAFGDSAVAAAAAAVGIGVSPAAAALTAAAADATRTGRQAVRRRHQRPRAGDARRTPADAAEGPAAPAARPAARTPAAAAAAAAPAGPWRALRSVALLALLCAGPIALLARQPGLLSELSLALSPFSPRPAPAGAGGAPRLPPARASAAAAAAATGAPPPAAGAAVRMLAVVAADAPSPFGARVRPGNEAAPWGDVIGQVARRLGYSDPRFELEVVAEEDLRDSAAARDSLRARLSAAGGVSLFAAVGVTDPSVAAFLSEATAGLRHALFWDCAPALAAAHRVDGFAPASAGALAALAARLGWSSEARAARVLGTLGELWGRHTSDDLLFTFLVVINEYITEVPAVANTTKGSDLKSIICMHNCRGLSAEPPVIPNPAPMATFQGAPLTHEAAEGIKRGWLGGPTPAGAEGRQWSWLVAAGKNPAYDYFPCQHQLYYPKGSAFWYEPVFKVITLQ